MALYERHIGEQTFRTFTVDGSDEDGQYAAKAAAGLEGWRRVDEQAVEQTDEPFDPASHTVAEVLAHLEHPDTNADEVTRIGVAEAEGKNRAGIIDQLDKILATKEAE